MEFNREKLKEELLKSFDDNPKQPSAAGKKPEIDLESEPGIPVKILLPFVVIVAIVGGVYAWKSGKLSFDSSWSGEAVVIKADTTPIRVKPEEPGGMYIANRDKLIYDTISDKDDNSLPKVVKILPRHEEPVEREDIAEKAEELFASLPSKIVEDKPEEMVEKTAAAENEKVESPDVIKKQELLSSDVNVVEADVIEPAEEVRGVLESITVDDIKNVPTPSIRSRGVVEPKKSNNGIIIQLGSFRTEGDVEKNWQVIKKKHGSLLGELQLNTQKADLGDKGIFYRLRVGSLNNESDARTLCKKLIEQKQGCFVVKK
ncbi:MAG: hypothetical protein COV35_03185 [Alphaproteobacteria bacterium CG11_big_fil_rev_8_21_14_0_20_39_49]|nr:MAG: hypothetical protein COV35_03185 [Alphaproteobacteria bacterium CG11_big_fil_rev_8_21_14_0_20_39_49]